MVHDPHITRPLRENRFLQALLAAYLLVWTVAAISPHARDDWALENLAVFLFATLLGLTHRRFVFSNLSYLLIFLFLLLHAIGAHYTYSLTPLGFWLQDAFALTRNHYDRIVHFAFGLLLTYPVRELTRRVLHVHGFWSYGVPAIVALSLSSAYEIIESWAARIVDPRLGIAFLGTQGDVWDAQKDMSLALVGAALCLAATACYRRHYDREPWTILAPREPRASGRA
jgi:putative membrane protein